MEEIKSWEQLAEYILKLENENTELRTMLQVETDKESGLLENE